MIAYFHSFLSTSSTNTRWDFTAPLLAIPPYQIDLSPSGPLKRVLVSGEGGDAILPADLGIALNGNIVALAEITDLDPSAPIFDPSAPPPSLEEINYLGLALVRGLRPNETHRGASAEGDNEDQAQGYTLHLLTPLPAEVLSRANCIIRNGAVELPLCGMLDWRASNAQDLAGTKWEEVPYLDVSGVVGVGGERRKFRRNLMRKGM
jgi:polynucleotide 5'-hydroxyl-kinase GRC3/NOL9